jgi:hypothetical protein
MKKLVNFTLDQNVFEDLSDYAAISLIPKSALVNRLLKEYLKNNFKIID